jgi:DNA-binding NarL/FixJ family response regulator
MLLAMTRIVVIDPQPAVRAGLAMMLRTEPGLVPVGVASSAKDGLELVDRQRPDVVLLDAGDLSLVRKLRAVGNAPRVVLYASVDDPALNVIARVAGADGLVSKEAEAEVLYTALRAVGRGGTALPPLDRDAMDAAAHRVEPEDLALLAMLVDRTEPAEVAATLRLNPRKMARRIERLLARLKPARPHVA